MQSYKRAAMYGFGVWLSLVVISTILFSLEHRDDALFESIKCIGLAVSVVGFVVLYMRNVDRTHWRQGMLIGSGWMAICILLDMVLYACGLFNISLATYFKDVASSYLIMPVLASLILGTLQAKR